MKELIALLGAALLTAALFIVGVSIGLFLGYLFGMLLAITPFISDWLTFNGALSKSQFPSITAWLAVAAFFLRANTTKGDDN